MKAISKNKKYTQGIFHPINKEKYKGSNPIIYRSSLELKTMRWFDKNSNVLSWGSESVVIPYIGPDGKMHRYFVDFVCEMRRKNGEVEKFLIEVKPQNQTQPPIITPNKKKKTILYETYTYATNLAKWQAAKEWCNRKNMKFLVLTEKHINS